MLAALGDTEWTGAVRVSAAPAHGSRAACTGGWAGGHHGRGSLPPDLAGACVFLARMGGQDATKTWLQYTRYCNLVTITPMGMSSEEFEAVPMVTHGSDWDFLVGGSQNKEISYPTNESVIIKRIG